VKKIGLCVPVLFSVTEFGLRFAKRVLDQVKKVSPYKILLQDQVEHII
jgi:hypothetical protein